jgi:uncharacterized protein YceK
MKSLLAVILVIVALLQSCDSRSAKTANPDIAKNDSSAQNDTQRKFQQVVNGIPVLDLPHSFAYWLNEIPPLKILSR